MGARQMVNTKTLSGMMTSLILGAAIAGLGAGAAQAADVAKGQAAFVRQCSICHTIDKGGDNRIGPNLFGIVGRRAGTMQDFRYTNAFRTTATFEWTEGLLGPWISLPNVMV